MLTPLFSICTNVVRSIMRKMVIFPLFLFAVVISSVSPGFGAEKRIGVIMTGDIPYYRDIHAAFMARLAKEGFGDRAEVIVQKPFPDTLSLSNAARKLIALDVDVIVAYGAPAALAVSREKTKIPFIYSGVYDPLVSKLTGKNITGISCRASVSSLLRYLRGIRPITSLGLVYSSHEEDSSYQARELAGLSAQYNIAVREINIKKPQDARSLLSEAKVDALLITHSSVAGMAYSTIMDYAREQRLPTASLIQDKSRYAIVTLYSSPKELGEKAAEKVAKVFNDVPPEKIKPEAASSTELVFNLKELIEIGLKIPMNLVTEATRLIQ